MIKKITLTLGLLCTVPMAIAQIENPLLEKGYVSLGLRTTSSFFGHDNVPGLGTGGHFRIQFLDKLSTEWFADWITMDLRGAGTRNNAHIGWSVLFYPKKMGRFTPYLIAGHCFDYARVTPLSTSFVDRSDEKLERWSSAVQMGTGAHYFLSPRFNLTLSAQYMLHLGNHLEYELEAAGNNYYLNTEAEQSHGESLEGHVLMTLSLNYTIGDLW